jgi:hypothetical protein
MKRIKHILWLLPLALVLCSVSLTLFSASKPNPMPFVKHWVHEFQEHKNKESFSRISKSDRPDLIVIRGFANRDWIAARTEYSCMDGAGFDATVFIDSKGQIAYQIGHHFCGYEGLCSELNKVEASSLAEFYTQMTNVHFQMPNQK